MKINAASLSGISRIWSNEKFGRETRQIINFFFNTIFSWKTLKSYGQIILYLSFEKKEKMCMEIYLPSFLTNNCVVLKLFAIIFFIFIQASY